MGRVKQTVSKSSGAPKKQLRPEYAAALAKKGIKVPAAVQGGIKKKPKATPPSSGGLAEDDEESAPTESTVAESRTKAGAAKGGEAGEERLGRAPVKKTAAWYARRYRELAVVAGYTVRSDEANESRGLDSSRSLLSVHDAARLMKFRARAFKGAQPYSESEAAEREAAVMEGAPLGAAKAVQIYGDALLRRLMLRCVRQSVDMGVKKVNTAAVYSVLRPFMARTAFTAGPMNKALLRELQKNSVLAVAEAEKTTIAEEQKASADDALGAAKEAKRAEARKANRATAKAK